MSSVLIACEMSGRVRDAFTAHGWDAWSCDLLPSMTPGNHYQRDVRDLLTPDRWDLLVAFPPCTDLSASGARWWPAKQSDGRQRSALDFINMLLDAPVPRIALENPVGKISSAIRKPDQIIQPWWFGDPYTKTTCLWLKDLPLLVPDNPVNPKGSWAWNGQEDSLGRKNRALVRSLTFPGIARAMASQWRDVAEHSGKRSFGGVVILGGE